MSLQLAKEVIQGQKELSSEEIERLCSTIETMYRGQRNVVDIPSYNVYFVGDLHGDLGSATKIRDLMLREKDATFVFLGDYADRGPQQIETVNLVMSLAIQGKERVVMLRGNHESRGVASIYGFREAVVKKHSSALFDGYCRMFTSLPVAGFSETGVFACHGGVPEGVQELNEIQTIDRRHEDFSNPTLWQLVWNDPSESDTRFAPSLRGGGSMYFGRIAFEEFTDSLAINRFIRAHEVYAEGYRKFFDG
ncbi:MAG: hypothetical protein EAX95_14275, partial [Candidatus Thorarchaeota archaeon]|nr:hypothetical protein [Candidatus Thorarchaeota archaeon]